MTEPELPDPEPDDFQRRREAQRAARAALSPRERLDLRLNELVPAREKAAVVVEARPHATRLGVGDILHLDLFVRNHGSEPAWVESTLRHADFQIRDSDDEIRDFPGWALPRDLETLYAREEFTLLQPGMGLGRYDATGDRLVLPEPGHFVLRVWVGTSDARICAYCYGFGPRFEEPAPDAFEIVVEP